MAQKYFSTQIKVSDWFSGWLKDSEKLSDDNIPEHEIPLDGPPDMMNLNLAAAESFLKVGFKDVGRKCWWFFSKGDVDVVEDESRS